jgi:hypothetical protein
MSCFAQVLRAVKRSELRDKTKMPVFIPPSDRYLEMVPEYPLRVIHSEAEYQHAIATLERLSDRGNGRTADECQ